MLNTSFKVPGPKVNLANTFEVVRGRILRTCGCGKVKVSAWSPGHFFLINRIITCHGDVFKEMSVNAERTVLTGE